MGGFIDRKSLNRTHVNLDSWLSGSIADRGIFKVDKQAENRQLPHPVEREI